MTMTMQEAILAAKVARMDAEIDALFKMVAKLQQMDLPVKDRVAELLKH